MEKIEDYIMNGWPTRVAFMNTSGGMHCLEYQVSEVDTYDLEKGLWDLREDRIHPLSGKTEKTYTNVKFNKDGPLYYSSELYTPLIEAKTRVIKCLQWKWAENFAEN